MIDLIDLCRFEKNLINYFNCRVFFLIKYTLKAFLIFIETLHHKNVIVGFELMIKCLKTSKRILVNV